MRYLHFIVAAVTLGLLLGGCAKTAEEKEIKKGHQGITIRLEGAVYPSKKETIIAPTTGKIKQIFVQVGDKIKKGQKILDFETTVTQFDIDKTKQELEYLTNLKRFLKGSKTDRANLALVNIAREKLERLARLKSRGYADATEISNAKEVYAANLHTKYSEKENNLERLRFLDERIIQTRNELKKLNYTLQSSHAYAHIEGFVTDLKTQVGDYVSQGAELGHVVNLDKVIVKAGIAPGLLPFVKEGKKVKIDFITTPPYRVEATISRVVMVVDPDFKRMVAEIEIPNKKYLLQEGTKALVTVYLDKAEQEFIRNNFLDGGNESVYEVKSGNY